MRRQKSKIFRTPDTYGYFSATYTPRQTVVHRSLGYIYRQYACAAYGHQRRKRVAMGDMPERKAEAIRTPRSSIWE